MTSLSQIEELFDKHLRSVDDLISFDRIILDVCLNHIDGLNERLKGGPFKITNPSYLAEGTLKAIGIFEVMILFEQIIYQCLILVWYLRFLTLHQLLMTFSSTLALV